MIGATKPLHRRLQLAESGVPRASCGGSLAGENEKRATRTQTQAALSWPWRVSRHFHPQRCRPFGTQRRGGNQADAPIFGVCTPSYTMSSLRDSRAGRNLRRRRTLEVCTPSSMISSLWDSTPCRKPGRRSDLRRLHSRKKAYPAGSAAMGLRRTISR
jgi:hypothetical protein